MKYFDPENEPFNKNYDTFDNDKSSLNSSDIFVKNLTNNNEYDNNDKVKKLMRFASDYCRASPNISFKENLSLNSINLGSRNIKSNFIVEFEHFSKISGEKFNITSIMTLIPMNKSPLNYDKEVNREGLKNLLFNLESISNCGSFLHLDMLYNQKILIKIQQIYTNGSIKDLIFKNSVSFNDFRNQLIYIAVNIQRKMETQLI